MFQYKICYSVALRAKAIFYEIQNFTLFDILLKLVSPASILLNIEIEKLFKIIASTVFNLNHQHFVSRLNYARPIYFYIFFQYPNTLADLLIKSIIFPCMILKRT